MIKDLITHLNSFTDSPEIVKVCSQLEEKMNHYFGHILDPTHADHEPLYVVATILSSNHHFLLSDAEVEIAHQYLTEEVSKIERLRGQGVTPGEDVAGPPPAKKIKLPPGLKYLKENDDLNKNQPQGRTHEIHQRVVTDLALCRKEMIAYKERVFAGEDWSDPLLYWEVNREKYMTGIVDYSLDILSTPASSVPSERMFSIAGILSSGMQKTILCH